MWRNWHHPRTDHRQANDIGNHNQTTDDYGANDNQKNNDNIATEHRSVRKFSSSNPNLIRLIIDVSNNARDFPNRTSRFFRLSVKSNVQNNFSFNITPGLTCPSDSVRGLNRFAQLSDADRIVGGEEAVRNSWPWIVRLKIGAFLCGGTIIGN